MDLRISVLLAAQRALWDVVTPNLRAVAIRVEPTAVEMRFLFENPPTDLDLENGSEAETELMADVPTGIAARVIVDEVPVTLPRVLQDSEEWLYLRQERPSAS